MTAEARIFSHRGLTLLGWVSVIAGLIANEWVLKALFSSDGIFETHTRLAIWAFDIALVFSGWVLVKLGNFFASDNTKPAVFVHAHPATTMFCVGIVLFAGALFCAELIFYGLNRYRSESEAVFEGGWARVTGDATIDYRTLPQVRGTAIDDKLLGYKSPANAKITQVKKHNNRTIYDAIYSTDQYHRRVTPVEHAGDRTKFLLFFGCSITFGQGVNDNETLPYYMGRIAPQFTPYNYGVIGYGPQSMLVQLQHENITSQVREKKGIGIYLFTDDHISRTVGFMHQVNKWSSRMPFFQVDRDDRLVQKGDFTSGRPVLSLIYWVLGKSEIAKYFKVTHPARLTEDHFKLAAKIIIAARDAFLQKFPDSEFYVVIGPAYWNERSYVNELGPYFRQAGVKYLDYSAQIWPAEQYMIEGDPHPSANGHKLMAERLARDLKINGKINQ